MKRKGKIILSILILSMLLGGAAVFSEPGSEKNPLVSLSYLNDEIDKLKLYIDKKIQGLETKPGEPEKAGSNEMEVVEVEEGQSLIAGSGTEIILRGGKGRIIGAELGGLADITAGKDLAMATAVPANHMLIVPRDDGRGVYVTEDAIFLVRGEYEIR